MQSYVHVLSPDRDGLLDFVEDAESSFLQFGIAPETSRPAPLSRETASEYAETSPLSEDTDGWFAYLTPKALAAVTEDETATVHYAGVAGMAVTDRVLRETTGTHTDVVLQSHTYTTAPMEYDVYRYDTDEGTFTLVATGRHS